MWRLRIVQVSIAIWSAIVLVFLARVQLIGDKELQKLIERQTSRIIKRPPFRGGIYDRSGKPLALSIPTIDIYQRLPPDSVKDYGGILRKLGIKLKETRPGQWKLLARNAPIEYRSLVLSRKVIGLSAIKTYQRAYPFGKLVDNVVGFVSRNRDGGLRGLEGLEKTLEDFIGGRSGYEKFFQSAIGERFYMASRKEPVPGENVKTTVDIVIQKIAYEAIKKKVLYEKAEWGFVIVTRPSTGEVLAISQYRNPESNRGYVNYAVQYEYEPGSTVKIFTLAKALEMGIIDEEDSVFVPADGLIIGNHRIRNVHRVSGYVSWRYALAHSINTAFAKLGLRIGADSLYSIFRRVGFGLKTDIMLNGETNGKLIKRHRKIEIANWAMGQGLSVNGIQMAMAYGCIANGGTLLAPRLILKIGNRNFDKPVIVRRCFSDTLSARLRNLLTLVVDSGSGRRARIEGVKVAGKTGTAQKYDPLTHSYSLSRVVTSFVGFFPADSPRYLIYVVVDEPRKNKYGGTVAAPVFREIATAILKYDSLIAGIDPLKLEIHENSDSKRPQGISSEGEIEGVSDEKGD